MKKLLFVFTGGTIGSTISGEYISTDKNKSYVLIEEYKKRFGEIGEYDTVSPYFLLSENLTGEYLSKLIETVKDNIHKYSGIIVTHGTDTLAYSASALGYALGLCQIPVVLVSANFPLEDERTNGFLNLRGALQFIKQVGAGGVWVSYKNTGDYVKIHRGNRLCPHRCFSHSVYSVKDSFFGYYDNKFNFVSNPDFSEKEDEMNVLSGENLSLENEILRVEPFPSMMYPEITPNVKFILMGSYHSGTIDTASGSAEAFFENAKEKGVKIFLTGVDCGVQYESTKMYSRFGIIPLPCMSPVSAYVKLWLLISDRVEDVESKMFFSLSGDVV